MEKHLTVAAVITFNLSQLPLKVMLLIWKWQGEWELLRMNEQHIPQVFKLHRPFKMVYEHMALLEENALPSKYSCFLFLSHFMSESSNETAFYFSKNFLYKRIMLVTKCNQHIRVQKINGIKSHPSRIGSGSLARVCHWSHPSVVRYLCQCVHRILYKRGSCWSLCSAAGFVSCTCHGRHPL